MSRWLKIALAVAGVLSTVALAVFASLGYFNNLQAGQHDQILDKLTRLDQRIVAVKAFIAAEKRPPQKHFDLLHQAEELRVKAELAWIGGKYDEANVYITEANLAINGVPEFPTALAAVIAIALSAGIYLLMRRRLARPLPGYNF